MCPWSIDLWNGRHGQEVEDEVEEHEEKSNRIEEVGRAKVFDGKSNGNRCLGTNSTLRKTAGLSSSS